jgi:flavin-dependent thymidylate synthase
VKVTLISHTPDALNLLIGTKTTRMRGKSPEEMTDSERYEHFQYMLDTIKSPFEFVDYVFEITEVSKNFTHQLVRTRTGAYQQETSRALEVTETVRPDAFSYPDESEDHGDGNVLLAELFDDAVADANAHYKQLIAAGAALQDARAVLPSNMQTAIKAKFNLRTMSEMAKNRLCARTQGEYQQAYRLMRAAVLAVHPWADPLLQVACVATGQCAFPRWGGAEVYRGDDYIGWREDGAVLLGSKTDPGKYDMVKFQCPHYRPWMALSKQKEELRISFWSRDEIAQANPIAKDGKSM